MKIEKYLAAAQVKHAGTTYLRVSDHEWLKHDPQNRGRYKQVHSELARELESKFLVTCLSDSEASRSVSELYKLAKYKLAKLCVESFEKVNND